MSTIDEIKRALEMCARRPDRMNFAALEQMITAAIAEARREGAEAVRLTDEVIDAIAADVDCIEVHTDGAMEFARAIEAAVLAANWADRDLRKAVRLTDEQIAMALHATTGDAADGVDFKAWALHPDGADFVELSRAIEAAVLAANGLGDGDE